MTTIEIAHRDTAQLGEGPTWHASTGTLIWVDILGSRVHRFDPADGGDTAQATPQHVGAAKPRAAGGLVVNLVDGIGRYDADGAFSWLARLAVDGCRGNDAAVDAHGHLWAGTMRYDEATGGGALYRIAPDGGVVTVLDDVTVSNGTGWSPDGGLMYYIDTPTRRIDVFDVDAESGMVRDRRPFVSLGGDVAGSPDGLCVDADGCVWVALWDGGAVHRYSPSGALDRVVTLPVTRPTACAFGGGTLYVTTARVGLSEAQLAEQPLAGSLLAIPDAGMGVPTHDFAG